jgi:hypothetical protein
LKDRSIFRKNIGRAILNRDGDPFLASWDLDMIPRTAREKHASSIDFDYQKLIEKQVSKFIQANFSFCVFRIDGRNDRLDTETRLISTVAACDACRPSAGWLGHHSPKSKIREGGLWLVNKLNGETYDSGDLRLLPGIIRRHQGA